MDSEQGPCHEATDGPSGNIKIPPPAKETKGGSEHDNGTRSVDSGYISGWDGSTNLKNQNQIIITEDAASRGLKSFSGKGLFLKSKQPELLLFRDAYIPDEVYSRFQDLIQLYDRPLKSKLKPKFMSWKVKVFGENENSKRPYIVILCDAESTKKITKFFAKKEIKQQCEGVENLPPLPVLVINSAPTKLSADEFDVFGREEVYLPHTNCGESLKIVHNGKAKMATLGGIVKVTIKGQVKLFGLTAGHVVEEELIDGDETIIEFSEESEGDTEGQDDDEVEDDGSARESSSTSTASPTIHVPKEDGRCNFGWKRVGHVTKPMVPTNDPEYCNLDWSLVELVDQDRRKMNIIKDLGSNDTKSVGKNQEIKGIYHRLPGADIVNRSVLYQPGTEPGYLKGKISTKPAFMLQYPSTKMARVYNMTWETEWDQVTSGDCGSWVVDRETHHLYGHIIAVDIFDEAYVVPFEDTAEQMRKYLGAEVNLPVRKDFTTTTAPSELSVFHQHALTPAQSVAESDNSDIFSELSLELDTLKKAWQMRQTHKSGYETPSSFAADETEILFENLLNLKSIKGTIQEQNSVEKPQPVTNQWKVLNQVKALARYCKMHNLEAPIYKHDELAVPNTLNLRSQSTVYICGMLYGASLWSEMHASEEEANELASREALRNLSVWYNSDIRAGLGRPTEVVSEATMDKFRQKQLEALLPKIVWNTRQKVRDYLTDHGATMTRVRKEQNTKRSMTQEQDLPAAVWLKKWFVGARKRHPAETIEALLHKQYDLEDEIHDAEHAQQSIRQEIQGLDTTLSVMSSKREEVQTERKHLTENIQMIEDRLKIIRKALRAARNALHASSLSRKPKFTVLPVM